MDVGTDLEMAWYATVERCSLSVAGDEVDDQQCEDLDDYDTLVDSGALAIREKRQKWDQVLLAVKV